MPSSAINNSRRFRRNTGFLTRSCLRRDLELLLCGCWSKMLPVGRWDPLTFLTLLPRYPQLGRRQEARRRWPPRPHIDGATTLGSNYDFIRSRGQFELHSALLVLLEGGGNVKVRNLDGPGPGAAGPVIGFRIHHSANDGIAADFFAVAISINQQCWRHFFLERHLGGGFLTQRLC